MLQIILRLPTVLHARGRSRSAHYADIRDGLYTRPIQIGERAVGWLQVEVEALNTARIAGLSDDQIRALVARLEAARPASFPTNNPNTNPRLKAGRDKFIADVRAGRRPAPRGKTATR
ncbi:MAG: AlpA family phage regulatory protein [Burkholderiales bacterium]